MLSCRVNFSANRLAINNHNAIEIRAASKVLVPAYKTTEMAIHARFLWQTLAYWLYKSPDSNPFSVLTHLKRAQI